MNRSIFLHLIGLIAASFILSSLSAATRAPLSTREACQRILSSFGTQHRLNQTDFIIETLIDSEKDFVTQANRIRAEMRQSLHPERSGTGKTEAVIYDFSDTEIPTAKVSIKFFANGEHQHQIDLQFKESEDGAVRGYSLGEKVLSHLNSHSKSLFYTEHALSEVDTFAISINDEEVVQKLNERLNKLLMGTNPKEPYWTGNDPRRPGDADETNPEMRDFELFLDSSKDSYLPSTKSQEFKAALLGLEDAQLQRELQTVFFETRMGKMFAGSGSWHYRIKFDMRDVDAGDSQDPEMTHLVYRYRIEIQRAD